MIDIRITAIPNISAVYYGLLQNGYEFHSLGRDEAMIHKLNSFADRHEIFPYFTHAKQRSCEVYPYWPRAALLETASFFIEPNGRFRDWQALQQMIYSFGNITDDDRSDAFWTWLTDFPSALLDIQNSAGFQNYLNWEKEWIEEQNKAHEKELNTICMAQAEVDKLFFSRIQQIEIVINLIKCIYSADYHLINDRFIFSSGRFDAASIVHESLHPVIQPLVPLYKGRIQNTNPRFEGLDPSYYLNGSEEGMLNAFEEALVRTLTLDLLSGKKVDLQSIIDRLLL